MQAAPSARGVAAFVAALWLSLTIAERPLMALVGQESAVRDRVNIVRRQYELMELRGHSALARVARAHAEEMARENYLDHVNPRGENPLDRVRASGIDGFRLLAENIGTTTMPGDRVTSLIEGWMKSPVHRENILNPAFNTTGIAVVETSDGRTIAVQLFATY